MPTSQSAVNNFTKGLLTEYTGLNFPENAATDTDNCVYSLVGDVTRRLGINYETGYFNEEIDRTEAAVNTYKWNNVGGDGETQIIVQQVGGVINFYESSAATVASPLSSQFLFTQVNLTKFVANGGSLDITEECQFADGNGYLFVYHPTCDPFFCTFIDNETITATTISLQIRDFTGIVEAGVPANQRPNPSQITSEHLYNITNQGWTQGNPWSATSTSNINPSVIFTTGTYTYTVASGLAAANGDAVNLSFNGIITPPYDGTVIASGTVTGYSGTSMTISISTVVAPVVLTTGTWTIVPTDHGYINTWVGDIGNYPSNADVWWYFKDSSDVFNPTTTIGNVTLSSGNAPRGHYTLNAFDQQRSLVSAIDGLTDITTTVRPRTGCWFQGRVWYAGVDASQVAFGDANFYTWTENIYFSQIVQTTVDFGNCYQLNDPTSENLFDLLPTDGGVITIQGAGSIYKLFPIANGMLVFAANGVWFITGNQGIGFSANDYTITKLSAVQSIASTSYVDVLGLPYFWNEEGIYMVTPQQGGSLAVEPITVSTILSFYNDIPLNSKKYVKGAYDPINYIIQWVYRSTEASDTTGSYTFDSVLNYNTYNKAFYPYSLDVSNNVYPTLNGIVYVNSPGGSNAPEPTFKYVASVKTSEGYFMSFADEGDTSYLDWAQINNGLNYTSYFVSGYRLAGKSLLRFQPVYVYMYSNNEVPTQYQIQGIWDYSNSGNSGRYSSLQLVKNNLQYAGVQFRRHKIRGRGISLQIKVTSVQGQPFDIIGWSSWEQLNAGI